MVQPHLSKTIASPRELDQLQGNQRALPERFAESAHAAVTNFVSVERQRLELWHDFRVDGVAERDHAGAAESVTCEVERLQPWQRPLAQCVSEVSHAVTSNPIAGEEELRKFKGGR